MVLPNMLVADDLFHLYGYYNNTILQQYNTTTLQQYNNTILQHYNNTILQQYNTTTIQQYNTTIFGYIDMYRYILRGIHFFGLQIKKS